MRYVCVCLVIFFVACKNGPPPVPPFDGSKIEGRWIIVDAIRKNRNTQTINGAIFDISDTSLTHNLFGQDSTSKITWGPSSMITPTDTFYIDSSLDSILVLKCVLQRLPLRLSLKKINEALGEAIE